MSKQSFTTGQVLTAAQVNSLQANDYNQTVSVKTASYVLVAADKGTRIEFNTSGSVTCTVNSGLFDAGDTLVIQNRGTGVVTVTAGTATVNTSATLALSQYDAGTLYFVSASASIFFNTDAGGGSPLTTKGDLYGFSTVDARIPIGSNNTVLTADSAQSLGLKWAAVPAPSSNWTLITSGTSTTGTSVSLAVSGYDKYILHFNIYSATTGVTMKFRLNNLSATNYTYGAFMSGATTTQTNVDGINLDNFSTFNDQPCGFLEINNANTGTKPQFFGSWKRANNPSDNSRAYLINYSGIYNANITLSSIDLVSTATISDFTYRLWGL